MQSVKYRLIIGMTAAIFPLFVLGIGSFFYLQTAISQIDEVMEEAFEEATPILLLESFVARSPMPANDYLIHGDVFEREEFEKIERQTVKLFELVLANRYDVGRERILLEEAQKQWHLGKLASRQILAIDEPLDEASIDEYRSSELMERMDVSFDKALINIHEVLKEMISEGADHANNARETLFKMIWLLGGTFIIGLALFVFVSFVVVRSIIAPLNHMQRKVRKFDKGELDTSISLNGLNNEFGELATVFNKMAEDIRNFSNRDGLTGILDRREFNRRILEEIQRAKRHGHSLGFLMIDIDHLKLINDEFGHMSGDAVLIEVVRKVIETLRPGDQTARYGGEEIAVMLPETSPDGAAVAAGRIRQAIAGSTFESTDGRDIRVTVSVGSAVYPDNALDETNLVSEAEAVLGEAKKTGRNKVVYSETVPEKEKADS